MSCYQWARRAIERSLGGRAVGEPVPFADALRREPRIAMRSFIGAARRLEAEKRISIRWDDGVPRTLVVVEPFPPIY